jgi:hypothetical protein
MHEFLARMFLPLVTRQLGGTRVAHLTSVALLWSNKLVITGQQFVVGRTAQPLVRGFHATPMFLLHIHTYWHLQDAESDIKVNTEVKENLENPHFLLQILHLHYTEDNWN